MKEDKENRRNKKQDVARKDEGIWYAGIGRGEDGVRGKKNEWRERRGGGR